jgi:hypothetical protein
MMNIVVQPPKEVGTGTILYPPLVVSCPTNAISFFAIFLEGADGKDYTSVLQGTPTTSPNPLTNQTTPNAEATEYAIFPEFMIHTAGEYRIKVQGISMSSEEGTVNTHVTSRKITVRETPVMTKRPCK